MKPPHTFNDIVLALSLRTHYKCGAMKSELIQMRSAKPLKKSLCDAAAAENKTLTEFLLLAGIDRANGLIASGKFRGKPLEMPRLTRRAA